MKKNLAQEQIDYLQRVIDSIQEKGAYDALCVYGVANVTSNKPIRTLRLSIVKGHFANASVLAYMMQQAATTLNKKLEDHIGPHPAGD